MAVNAFLGVVKHVSSLVNRVALLRGLWEDPVPGQVAKLSLVLKEMVFGLPLVARGLSHERCVPGGPFLVAKPSNAPPASRLSLPQTLH